MHLSDQMPLELTRTNETARRVVPPIVPFGLHRHPTLFFIFTEANKYGSLIKFLIMKHRKTGGSKKEEIVRAVHDAKYLCAHCDDKKSKTVGLLSNHFRVCPGAKKARKNAQVRNGQENKPPKTKRPKKKSPKTKRLKKVREVSHALVSSSCLWSSWLFLITHSVLFAGSSEL
jgi:hypothetical protein